jgi:hypothetical protein
MTRPTIPGHLRRDPALDLDDLLTAAEVHQGMRHVTMTAPTPTAVPGAAGAAAGTQTTATAHRPTAPVRAPHRRRLFLSPAGLAASAVVMVAGIAVATVVANVAAPSAAWSATPTRSSASDEARARQACADVPAEPAGEDRVGDKGRAPARPAPAGPPTLPPLAVLDVRGNGAVAIFADERWTADCVLTRRGDRWERLASTLSPSGTTVSAVELSLQGHGSTIQPDGTAVSYLAGHAGAGISSVRLVTAGGEPILASLARGHFALWWPTELNVAGARLVGLDGAGRELASVDVDAVLATKSDPRSDSDRQPPPGPGATTK